jgi:4-amino-4-deoxy-L-arabinose transferase-like glycosyltransferase
MPTTEEIPVYYGLVAAGYRLFGEQDWFGRAVSGLGSLVAILAFVGLMRREFDDRFALLAGFFLAFSPLLLFYGRTVLPDPCMLAGMLAAAYCFRRALDQGGVAWVILSGVAGLAAVGFKYYGLMVLLPMTEMAWRQADRRKANVAKLALAAAIMIVPLAAWMLLVFFQTANPARGEAYFVFQRPAVLMQGKLWTRLFDNFLWKSCGPLGTVFLTTGVLAVILRRVGMGKGWFVVRPSRLHDAGETPAPQHDADGMAAPKHSAGGTPAPQNNGGGTPAPQLGVVLAWTAMSLGFYVLLAPKSVKHDYYELMMLPAAAAWAAIGFQALGRQARQWGMRPKLARALGIILLATTAVVQSPWVSGARFRPDTGFVFAAESAQKFCSERGRLVVGPLTPQAIIHLAHREGWTWHEYPDDWRSLLRHYREHGGECVVLYFDRKTSAAERAQYAPMLKTLPILEKRSGPWGLGETPCEYYILRLSSP